MATPLKLKLGSRKSPLAMAQAALAAEAVAAAAVSAASATAAASGEADERILRGIEIEIVPITSEGDRDQKTRLDRFTEPGVFTRALEDALLDKIIDAAVHSAKDLPSALSDLFCLAGALEREDAHDAFVAGADTFLMSLPEGARVGSSSPRRIAQLRRVRADLEFLPLRGNLQTRLEKLDRREVDALLLAAAGLRRLGLQRRISELIPFDVCLPAAGQGIIVLERLVDSRWAEILDGAGSFTSRLCLDGERAFLRTLGAGCSVAVAGHASVDDGALRLDGRVLDKEGGRLLAESVTRSLGDDGQDRAAARSLAARTGVELAEALLARGAAELI